MSYLHSICDPFKVEIALYGQINHDPIGEADLKSYGFKILSNAITDVFPESIVVPSIMIGATDSRHYINITNNIYRFYPWMISKEEINTIHGDNEKISTSSFLKSIKFYEILISNSPQ